MYLTGWSYDLYGAAADLIDEQLNEWATKYDFSANGGSYSRSQAYDRLKDLAFSYKTRQKGMATELAAMLFWSGMM